MKKINDEIVKYLSGIMSESEKKIFEEKLRTSNKTADEINSVQKLLGEFKENDFNADENYFVNILPRFRENANTRSGRLRKLVYYLAPTFAVIIITLLLFEKSTTNNYDEYIELAEVVVNNIEDSEVSNSYLNYINLEPEYGTINSDIDLLIEFENNESSIPDSYLNVIETANAVSFDLLEELTDEDLTDLYDGLYAINL
jgi:hypothetical protein